MAMGVALTKDSIDLGIVVSDIEASLAFYRDTLGFTPAGDGPMPGGSHMWRLMYGTTMIKLLTFDPAPAAKPAKGGIGGGFGYRYWTMSVSNIHEITTACEAGGYKVRVPVTEIMKGTTISMVEDPDGNWVEFLTRG
jgi:catechol 2,3-dioxygenase-like lactoylglutathione lyase family enzyme